MGGIKLYGDHHGRGDHADEPDQHGHFVGHAWDEDLFYHAFDNTMYLTDKGHLFVVHRHPKAEEQS